MASAQRPPLTPNDAPNDAPLPPPAAVAEVIPPFHQHGPRNCGDHHHDATNQKFSRHFCQGEDESTAWNLSCTLCHARATLNQLHDLPCGDLICRDCLLVKALGVTFSINRNREKIQELWVKMEALDVYFCNKPDVEPREKKLVGRRYGRHRLSVLRLAGLTCCRVSMRLDRFLACMGTAVSRDLWLAMCWVSDAPRAQRACAWPDCGAYLPVCCRYAVPTASARRWYCVVCQGNSMDCVRTLEAAQTRFPFLRQGHDALTPSR